MTLMSDALALKKPSGAGRAKGPLVWLDMDQKELDDAYDQQVYAPNREQIQQRMARNSALTRERLGKPLRFAYGPTPVEGLDVYTTKALNAPVAVYVHGGAWRGGSADNCGFIAETFVTAGAHLAILDFTNVTETGGDLMPMMDQVRRGLIWVYRNAQKFGGDPERLYIVGHSSGAHLTGNLLTTDWQEEFGVPPTFIKGGTIGSGMYDLKPVRLSKRSEYVNFSDRVEEALSSQRHLDRLVAPVTVLYGTYETPEFQRQGREFAAAVKATGAPVRLIVCEGYNHFEVMETLGNPFGLFGRAALAQMKLAAP
jgi:arylformamidase